MSIQDAARAALAQWEGRTVAGMDLPTVMVAIAGAESAWQNGAPGDALGNWPSCDGYESWGLWQIHLPSHAGMLQRFTFTTSPCYWAQWLRDPDNNARAADAVIGSAAPDLPLSALAPWTTWWSRDGGRTSAGDGNGNYLDFWDRAVAAVAAERGGGLSPPDEPEGSPGGPVSPPAAAPAKIGAGTLGLAAVAGLLVGAWMLVDQGDQ